MQPRTIALHVAIFSCFLIGHVPAAGGTPTSTILELSVRQTTYVHGEPILVMLALVNNSDTPIPMYFADDEDFGRAGVTFAMNRIDGEDKAEIRIRSEDIVALTSRIEKAPPGTRWCCERMFLATKELRKSSKDPVELLPPGEYTLVAMVGVQGPRGPEGFASNPVRIVISPPTPSEASAFALLRTSLAEVRSFFRGDYGGLSVPGVMRELLERYPESTYARYARARILLDCANHHWGDRPVWAARGGAPAPSSQPTTFPYGPEQIINEGLAFVQQYPQMPLSDNILLYCGRMHQLLRQEDQARQLLERIPAEYPDSDIREIAEKRLAAWRSPRDRGSRPAE